MSDCKHENEYLHPGRVDGVRTVCTKCRHPIIVSEFLYASGTTQEEQYLTLLEKLREQEVPR